MFGGYSTVLRTEAPAKPVPRMSAYVHVEVREGPLLVGMGDELDAKHAQALAAGDSARIPAGMHHFWIASGRTVASLRFMGPFTITYLRAEDAPRSRVFPYGY